MSKTIYHVNTEIISIKHLNEKEPAPPESMVKSLASADIQIQNLLDKMSSPIVTFEENALYGLGIGLGHRELYAFGLYNPQLDLIAINNWSSAATCSNKLKETILHELGHRSGHSTRLARKAIVVMERVRWPTEQELSLEECIAQYSCYYMAMRLGYDPSYFTFALAQYLTLYPSVDLSLASLKGMEAANYVLEIMESGIAA